MIKLNEIRERIIAAITESGLTQTALANMLHIKQPTIGQYLSGRALPALDTFANLCDILNISPSYILGLTEQETFVNENKITDDQQYILREYNKLSSSDKQKIVNYMAVCSTKAEKKSDNSFTPMEEELIRMTRKLEDKNQLAQILGFLEELLEDSNNRKKDTNSNNNHRNIG